MIYLSGMDIGKLAHTATHQMISYKGLVFNDITYQICIFGILILT